MPDKQAAAVIVIESRGQRTDYIERARGMELSLEGCRRADEAQWAYEKILEPPGAAEAQSFFQEWCPDDRLPTSKPEHALLREREG